MIDVVHCLVQLNLEKPNNYFLSDFHKRLFTETVDIETFLILRMRMIIFFAAFFPGYRNCSLLSNSLESLAINL